MRGPGGPPRPRLVEEPLWLAGATRTRAGNLVANVHNARLYLEGCPYLPGEFYVARDEMLQTVVAGTERLPLADELVARLVDWFEAQGFKNYPAEYISRAILIVAGNRRFNPLQDWLSGLVWDKHERVSAWLHDYLGTPNDDYHFVIGSNFLRGMIARALWPGCKCDYMLVLEGPQRRLKSTVCETLACGYFSDSLPELSGDPVRLAQHLRGKWLIEVSELHAFSRAEASRLKQFLSSKTEIFTPKYGRNEVHEPRTCCFVGTTNKATYLRDETGGSRFWPVRCGEIALKELEQDVEQLMAEAFWQVTEERRDWWPPREFEEQVIGPMQDSRYQGDAWEQPVAKWDRQLPDYVNGETTRFPLDPPFFLAQIAEGALGIRPGLLRKAEEMRLAQVLEFMGWTRGRRTNHGTPWWPPSV